jgi:hypothetical protein
MGADPTAGLFTDNYAIAPDATNTATRLQAVKNNALFRQFVTGIAGIPVTGSFWIKVINPIGRMTFDSDGGAYYDTNTDGWPPTNEWVRISGSYNPTGNVVDIYLGAAGAEVLVWGLQVETGTVLTSYIFTAGAAVTRVADDLRYIGGPTAEMSMQIGWEMDQDAPTLMDWRLFGSLGVDADSELRSYASVWENQIRGTGLITNMLSSDLVAGKHIHAWGAENANQKQYFNGELKIADTQAVTLDHSNEYIQLGRWKTQPTMIPLRFSTFKLWNLALPDDELQALSSQDYNC